MRAGALISGLALAAATLIGCAAAPPADTSTEAPPDFALSVMVFGGDEDPARAQARYVLDADGSLRAATGLGVGPRTLPPALRRLGHEQRERVWRLALGTRVHDPANPYRVGSGDVIGLDDPGQVRHGAVVTMTWRGERASGSFPFASDAGPAAGALVDELARLSWVAP